MQDYEIQIEYESMCPLACLHCSSADIRNKNVVREFSDNQLIRFIKAVHGNKHVYLTGGEPLSNKELINFCTFIHENSDAALGLYTCGLIKDGNQILSVSNEFANALHAAGVVDSYFSIYSTDSDTHNKITGSDSYSKTLASMKAFLNVGIEAKVHFVLTEINKSTFELVFNDLSKIGVKEIRVLKLVKTGAAKDNWGMLGIPYSEQNEIIAKIAGSFNIPDTRITISGFPEIMPCRAAKDAVGCQAGVNLLYITYNGAVYPCACVKGISSFLIGNISDPDVCNSKIKDMTISKTCLNRTS